MTKKMTRKGNPVVETTTASKSSFRCAEEEEEEDDYDDGENDDNDDENTSSSSAFSSFTDDEIQLWTREESPLLTIPLAYFLGDNSRDDKDGDNLYVDGGNKDDDGDNQQQHDSDGKQDGKEEKVTKRRTRQHRHHRQKNSDNKVNKKQEKEIFNNWERAVLRLKQQTVSSTTNEQKQWGIHSEVWDGGLGLLAYLSRYLAIHEKKEKRKPPYFVLDLGSGTGVVGIGLALLLSQQQQQQQQQLQHHHHHRFIVANNDDAKDEKQRQQQPSFNNCDGEKHGNITRESNTSYWGNNKLVLEEEEEEVGEKEMTAETPTKILLTDLPEALPLLRENVRLNFPSSSSSSSFDGTMTSTTTNEQQQQQQQQQTQMQKQPHYQQQQQLVSSSQICRVMELTWSTSRTSLPMDIQTAFLHANDTNGHGKKCNNDDFDDSVWILGADIVYRQNLFEPLLTTLDQLHDFFFARRYDDTRNNDSENNNNNNNNNNNDVDVDYSNTTTTRTATTMTTTTTASAATTDSNNKRIAAKFILASRSTRTHLDEFWSRARNRGWRIRFKARVRIPPDGMGMNGNNSGSGSGSSGPEVVMKDSSDERPEDVRKGKGIVNIFELTKLRVSSSSTSESLSY